MSAFRRKISWMVKSNSIANQKKILERYCKDHGITAYRHYDEDDGYSGTNFVEVR